MITRSTDIKQKDFSLEQMRAFNLNFGPQLVFFARISWGGLYLSKLRCVSQRRLRFPSSEMVVCSYVLINLTHIPRTHPVFLPSTQVKLARW